MHSIVIVLPGPHPGDWWPEEPLILPDATSAPFDALSGDVLGLAEHSGISRTRRCSPSPG